MYIVPDDVFNRRFWQRTDRSGDCWIWAGPVNNKGYGLIARHRRKYLVHRYAYELTHGPIPPGLCVCHDCPNGDNRLCINPAHLFLGTVGDNNRDMVTKGRAGWQIDPEARARGEDHGRARLAETDVRLIRVLIASGERRAEVAARYGVSLSLITKIVNREVWAHVN